MLPDAPQLFLEQLDTIDRVVAFTCRRHGIEGADAQDFASAVKLKLIEDDYKIVRKFEGRSSFSSYVSIVVQRLLSDDRNHTWGKWRTSAEAKRCGELGIELEKLVRRDGRSIGEAFLLLSRSHDGLTLEQLQAIDARLPERAPRRRFVDVEDAASLARTTPDDSAQLTMEGEREEISTRVCAVIRSVVDELSEEDQLVLKLKFEGGMTIAQIARALQVNQKLLYKRLQRQLTAIRNALIAAGIDAAVALDLVEHGFHVDLPIGKAGSRPSTLQEEASG